MGSFKGRADRRRVIELLSEMVAIDSVNPAAEGGAGEEEMGRYLAGFLQGLGFQLTMQEVHPGRSNLLASLPVPGRTRTLLFEAHMDTVTGANMPGAFSPRVEGNRLYGRGSCDVKGSTAAFLHSLELLAPYRDRLPANILFLAAVDEEVGFGGSRHFVKQGGHADSAVVFEPTGLRPVIAHKGALRVRIATHGRSAHTSRPDLGDNAIYQMADLIRALRDQVEARLPERQHSLCGPATLSVTRISGGIQDNIVPPQCTIDIDWRTLPDEEPDQVLQRLQGFLSQLRTEQPWIHAEVDQVLRQFHGLDTPIDAPIVQTSLAACLTVLGHSGPTGAPYATDASELSGGGIPSVVLGPGDIAQAHTSEEWVEIDQLVAAAEIYAEIALNF